MIRLEHPDGRAFLLERLLNFRVAKLAKVARTFQNIRLFPGMTVLENLRGGAAQRPDAAPRASPSPGCSA